MLRQLTDAHQRFDAPRFPPPSPAADIYGPWLAEAVPGAPVLALLAELDARPAGYLLAEDLPADPRCWSPPCLYIHDLFVDPAARAAGLASRLFAHARDWAHARGIRQIRALVAAPNADGAAFFAAKGFRPAAREFTLDLP